MYKILNISAAILAFICLAAISCGNNKHTNKEKSFKCNYLSLTYPKDWILEDSVYTSIGATDKPWAVSSQIQLDFRKPNMDYNCVIIKRIGTDFLFASLPTPKMQRDMILYATMQSLEAGNTPYSNSEIVVLRDSTKFMGYPSADVGMLEYYDNDTLIAYTQVVFAEESRYNFIVRVPYHNGNEHLINRDIDDLYEKVLYNIKFYNYKDKWDATRRKKLKNYRY